MEGKRALITGGSSGIGLAIAQRFTEERTEVIITGRSRDRLELARGKIKGNVTTIVADMRKEDDVRQMMEKAGHFNMLVNNAGIAQVASLEETPTGMLDEMIDINFKGVFWACKYAVSHMGKDSCIINISSITGLKGVPGFAVYGATKAAVINLTKTLALELAEKGIRVNCIAPGAVDTPIFKKMGLSEEEVKETLNEIARSTPLKRVGKSEEIADAVVFLVQNDYTSGAVVSVDGGQAGTI